MKTLFIHFYKAFRYSAHGLVFAWRNEWAFQVEFFILLLALPFAFYFSHTPGELVQMISSVALLPILELLNSAIETVVDRIGLEYHELSKAAKDLGSAAMFLAGLNVLLTWGILVIGHFVGFG